MFLVNVMQHFSICIFVCVFMVLILKVHIESKRDSRLIISPHCLQEHLWYVQGTGLGSHLLTKLFFSPTCSGFSPFFGRHTQTGKQENWPPMKEREDEQLLHWARVPTKRLIPWTLCTTGGNSWTSSNVFVVQGYLEYIGCQGSTISMLAYINHSVSHVRVCFRTCSLYKIAFFYLGKTKPSLSTEYCSTKHAFILFFMRDIFPIWIFSSSSYMIWMQLILSVEFSFKVVGRNIAWDLVLFYDGLYKSWETALLHWPWTVFWLLALTH